MAVKVSDDVVYILVILVFVFILLKDCWLKLWIQIVERIKVTNILVFDLESHLAFSVSSGVWNLHYLVLNINLILFDSFKWNIILVD